ncbi:MAG TPA: flavodoxin family protein [bacterium]|nr:flavodoxin family protein [bacterium]
MLRKKRTRKGSFPRCFKVRKGQGSVDLARDEFQGRLAARFSEPPFAPLKREIAAVAEAAWKTYNGPKSARTRKAGRGFAEPDFELPAEWLETRRRLIAAERRQKNRKTRSRVLLVCASPRSDQTCPGEISKTFRLAQIARKALEGRRLEVDFLDLSRLASEYGRIIYPCKACVSTSMALCHWPCSCYPNHALGQVNDWMAEIYEKWVSAHGILIVTPVHWYQAPSVLKLMMDRLVCADGGNPDPTTTHGKDPARAKRLELEGWDYPKHLAGRVFSVVAHGDATGVESVRRALTDWLIDMELQPAGNAAAIGRYIGYYEPYATSHEALDGDAAVQTEVKNAALTLAAAVRLLRLGKFPKADEDLRNPRPK